MPRNFTAKSHPHVSESDMPEQGFSKEGMRLQRTVEALIAA